jgi:hypothetical protein
MVLLEKAMALKISILKGRPVDYLFASGANPHYHVQAMADEFGR